jgi:PAS domain S-box-containing protein
MGLKNVPASVLIENAPEPVLILNSEGNIKYVNQSFEDCFGYSREDVLGKHYTEVEIIAHNEAKSQDGQGYWEPLEGKLPEPVDYEFEGKNGETYHMVPTSFHVTDTETGQELVVVFLKDISDLVHTQDQLAFAQAALDNAVYGVAFSDSKANLTYVNDAFCELWGYSDKENLIGEHLLLSRTDSHKAKDILEAIAQNGYWSGEIEGILKDGSKKYIQMSATRVKEHGIPHGIMASFIDVTERKEAQEKLVRNERLAALGQLSGGIAHELRNPLGAIKNSVYFLRMALEDPDEDIEETLEILDEEVQHSVDIIESLLYYAKPKPPTRMKVDITKLLEDLISSAEIPNDIEVTMEFDKEIPVLLADPVQLERVFGNLIRNAVQAMPEGGRLKLSAKCCADQMVQVKVEDTGEGIPEENLEKVFEPLFTTKAKGIGLGLAIVNSIVEAHDGSISVKSKGGKGTFSTVELPLPEVN